MNLVGAVLVNGQSYTGKKYSFRISCIGESNPYYFLADNDKVYKSWFSIIGDCIEHLKQSHNNDSSAVQFILPNERSDFFDFGDSVANTFDESFIPFEDEDAAESLLTPAEMELIDNSLEKHLSKHPECAGTIISDHVQMILKYVYYILL